MAYPIRRHIGIDAGHRVPTHGSKCANLHGHRYEIWAEVEETSRMHAEGEQQDMTLDFGFLKTLMMEEIDKYCDHGLILWAKDPLVNYFAVQAKDPYIESLRRPGADLMEFYFQEGNRGNPHKLLITTFIPTAERLASFWFYMLAGRVNSVSKGLAILTKVEVFETPNGSACYSPYNSRSNPLPML